MHAKNKHHFRIMWHFMKNLLTIGFGAFVGLIDKSWLDW